MVLLYLALIFIFVILLLKLVDKPKSEKLSDIGIYLSEEDFKKSKDYPKYIEKKEAGIKKISEIKEKHYLNTGDRSKLCDNYNLAIKGLYYRPKECQYRADTLKIGEELFLRKEPSNKRDKFAVGVYTDDGYHIGYIDSGMSHKISEFIDNNFEINCFLSRSTEHEIPYQYMDLYFLGDNPNYNPLEIKYQKEAKRLKMIITRANDTINSTDKEHIKIKAIERIESSRVELADIERKLSDLRNNLNNN